jgi:hypothetical protein
VTDLVEFLRTRTAEDEAWAQNPECDQDPDRLLREVEAKRRIVGWADSPALPDYETNYVLTSLALPYSDHEEFKEEWRP